MRLLSVVGARPNFMKIGPIFEELKAFPAIENLLVHSGQHYDQSLSGNFFSDLGLPKPDVNLQVGSGSQAAQTAHVMMRLEPVLLEFKPDMVLVVGDVNSTLAAALTAVKLGIRVAHVEAGLRSFDMAMPEEINRKLTDAIADLLFVTEKSGVENLRREGVAEANIFLVGNVMIDSLLRHRELARRSPFLQSIGIRTEGPERLFYGVLTLHRPSNVDDAKTLAGILDAVREISQELPIYFPMHPRTRKNISSFGLEEMLNDRRGRIVPLNPLGYLDFLCLNDHARIVLTDSGGVQEETTVLGVPCLTLRNNTERPATVEHGTNRIVGTERHRIVRAAQSALQERRTPQTPPLWDGKAAGRIVEVLRTYGGKMRRAVSP